MGGEDAFRDVCQSPTFGWAQCVVRESQFAVVHGQHRATLRAMASAVAPDNRRLSMTVFAACDRTRNLWIYQLFLPIWMTDEIFVEFLNHAASDPCR